MIDVSGVKLKSDKDFSLYMTAIITLSSTVEMYEDSGTEVTNRTDAKKASLEPIIIAERYNASNRTECKV